MVLEGALTDVMQIVDLEVFDKLSIVSRHYDLNHITLECVKLHLNPL